MGGFVDPEDVLDLVLVTDPNNWPGKSEPLAKIFIYGVSPCL